MKVTHNNIKGFLYTPGKYFVIPDFQRPYSWEKPNVISFLSDLESVKSGEKNHFFGSVVYINEGDNSVIIDGQQRATTVLLMLTAIYHIVEADPSKCAIPAEQIKESYLFNKFAQNYGSEENRIKLRTVTTDNEIFERIFENEQLDEKSKESKLYRSYNIFFEYFIEKESLEEYIDTLDNFEIVTIALDSSDDNPQKVFESINSTGKPLTDGDKIRNFALMLNDNDAREVVLNKYWKVIENNLTDINKDFITDFFRNYLTGSLQRDVKIEQVYSEFKRSFEKEVGEDQSNTEKLQAFYDAILRNLEHYIFLKFNKDDNGYYTHLKDLGFRLNYLKIEVIYPFLIRVLDDYRSGSISESEINQIFSTIETYLARRVICNVATQGLNNLFSILHKEITTYIKANPTESYPNVLSFVLLERTGASHMPTDKEVELAVRSNPFYAQRNYYNLFILSSVDDKLQSKESALLRQLSGGEVELTIEHVMPQTLNSAWRDMLGKNHQEIHDQYLHTLPNLTLTGYNSKYSNKDFSSKKTMENGFDQSPLIINQFIKELSEWDLGSLEKRSEWWVDMISKVWPMPTTTFSPPSDDIEYMFKSDDDLSHTKVKSVSVLGETSKVASWVEAFEIIVEKLFEYNPQLPEIIADDEFLIRYIRTDGSKLIRPLQIKDTVYFVEGGTNTNYKKMIVMKLAEYLEVDETDIRVIIAR